MSRKPSKKIFLILLLCTTYIFSFSYFGSSAYMTTISESNTFSTGKMVQTKDVAGKSKQAATDLVGEKVEKRKNEVINTAEIKIKGSFIGEEKLDSIKIPAQSTFSLLEFLNGKKLLAIPNSQLNMLASGIYQLILPSNFKIKERHIGAEFSEEIKLGFEAKISPDIDWDLAFENPNVNEYRIDLIKINGGLRLQLVGLPFVNQYTVSSEKLQFFEPKTIKRYDPLLGPGETEELNPGKKAVYLEIYRKTLSLSGEIISSELVSKDYYPPIHRIIAVSITHATHSEQQETSNSTLEPGAIQENSENQTSDLEVKAQEDAGAIDDEK